MDNGDLQYSELLRRVASIVLVGRIQQVNYGSAKARVAIGDIVTDWRPWITGIAMDERSWSPPQVGEQVLLICPNGDTRQAIIIGSLYQTAAAAPSASKDVRRIEWSDGTVVEYNKESHTLTANVHGSAVIEATGAISLKASAINMEADQINVQGPVTQTGGDMTSDGISAQTHVHGGVMPGGGNTGQPV